MAVERNILGWQMADNGEFFYAGGGSWVGMTIQATDGRPGSGPFRLQLATQTAANTLYALPARLITGTSGTVSSGNHKRVRSRIYFRIESVGFPFGNSDIRIHGTGNQTSATAVNVWMDSQRQLAVKVGNSAPANSGSGFSGSHTAPLSIGVIYRLILDIDYDVGATTLVTALLQVTTDSASPDIDNTVSDSLNIGASDALGRMSLLSEVIRGGFDTFGTFSFFDWVYVAASDADAVSTLELPEDNHIFAIVPPTGEVINQWNGTHALVDEYPVTTSGDTMDSSLGTGTEVQFSHASGIALSLGHVAAIKLYVNATVVSGTGNCDMILNGTPTTILLGINYGGINGASDIVGGLLWTSLTPQQFSAITFGVEKQNGTQQTFIGNIGLEVLGTAVEYGTGSQIRGETQIMPGTIFDAQISDDAGIQRHKVQGLQGTPVFFHEEVDRDEWMIPGPRGSEAPVRITAAPVFFQEEGAEGESMPMAPGGGTSSGGGGTPHALLDGLQNNDTTGAAPAKGALISSDGSTWRRKTVGSDGQVLTADSSDADGVVWSAPGGGGSDLVLLEEHTVSGGSEIDFTSITGLYDDYFFRFKNVIGSVANADLKVRFSTDGGASFDSSAIYDEAFQYVSTTNSSASQGTVNLTQMDIGGDAAISATGGFSGQMNLYDPLSSVAYKAMEGRVTYGHNSVGRINIDRSFLYRNTAPVDAVRFFYDSGTITGTIRLYAFKKTPSSAPNGKIVQVVNFQTGAVATGGTVIPLDDTIPQNTEGNEYMTLAITPSNAANKLLIEVKGMFAPDAPNWITAALFQDSVASALAAMSGYQFNAGGHVFISFAHYMVAGTTSSTTFKVRAGRDASSGTTITFNGSGGTRLFGGVLSSSITITEILP